MQRQRPIAWVPSLTLIVLIGPVAMGLIGTLLPAFGYLPGSAQAGFDLSAFRALMDWPGLGAASRLSLTTGFLATTLSLGIVVLIMAGWHGTRAMTVLQRLLAPLLSVPHAAAAFGLAFLIAPSGWIARALSPWATGWEQPPDLLILQDPWGLSMVLGLVTKEVPFLLLMTLAALAQIDARRLTIVTGSLGYGRVSGWIRVVFPLVYAQIRLPVYVVLAYSMSVVDVAVILGPNTPPTLSVQIVRWMSDPDIAMRLQAAAAAVLQFALVVAAMALWRLGEACLSHVGRTIMRRGARHQGTAPLRALGLVAGTLSAATVLLGLAGLAAWSVAGLWSFPQAWPDAMSLRAWMRHGPDLGAAMQVTALVAVISSLIALILTLGCLEAEHRYGLRLGPRGLLLLYLPLLIPQTAFLPGLQTLFLLSGISVGLVPVILVHVIYVLPYVFLSLSDPFRAWDGRYAILAAGLGATPDRVLWRLRLPMLLAPLLTALAVGLAVSVGQYLPTLLMGGGRVQSLTTEAVALAAGGDRRAIGVFGLAQTGAALLPFALAVLLPPLIWRNRRGLLADE